MNELVIGLRQILLQNQQLLIGTLVLARVSSMLALTPFFGSKAAPFEVKMGLAVGLSLVVYPLAYDAARAYGPIPVSAIPFLLLMLKEIFIGGILGFVVSKLFWAMEVAGRLIDTTSGTAMAEVLVPQSGSRATPFGDLLYQLLIVFFMALGGHRWFIQNFAMSFQTLPLNHALQLSTNAMVPFFEHMIRLTADLMMLGILVATPVVAATFITDLVFGILNRVAPQLNAYFMSMPVKSIAGVIMTFLLLAPLAVRIEDYVVWHLRDVETTLELIEVGQEDLRPREP